MPILGRSDPENKEAVFLSSPQCYCFVCETPARNCSAWLVGALRLKHGLVRACSFSQGSSS